jgi:23S rRNA (pseudouridine1915-N3)-methyltransferase
MRVLIAAVGKLKDAEERAICARYGERFNGAGRPLGLGPLDTIELSESRAASTTVRRQDEAQRLLKAADKASLVIALDGCGTSLSSERFAAHLSEQRDGGCKAAAFLIGGPDGHGDEVLSAASLRLSLGALTLPHGLARVILTEQLYRAATILAGHPYHRA